MVRQKEEETQQQLEQKGSSLRSKAVHFVSDITTILLNPISDKPSSPSTVSSSHNDLNNSEHNQSDSEEGSQDSADVPDTSSFAAFMFQFLPRPEHHSNNGLTDGKIDSPDEDEPPIIREYAKKRSLFSRGKQSIGKVFSTAARLGSFRSSGSKGSSELVIENGNNSEANKDNEVSVQPLKESPPSEINLPETSEASVLLTEKTRGVLYTALPVIVQGRKWVLLYSTWRHGISLSTLYRRSMLWPGLSLLVVGDRNGGIFGGLVEAPLNPTNKRRYQGTNNSFVFTNVSGDPAIFRPTGINRYFTLCSTEYLALGGGSHFALYLDGDLLRGSSSSSETYGNPCLSCSEEFPVKEIELWGFIYASKYEEIMASLQSEAPGICHW